MVNVFIPKENRDGETRVAASPETVKQMDAAELKVVVEKGAGVGSSFSDSAYEEAGAEVTSDRSAALAAADIVLSVNAPDTAEADALKAEALLVAQVAPHQNPDVVKKLQDKKVSTLALELVPRITRAQEMDVLSSQASIAGYKAVLLAAQRLDKYFPLLMTAAGTIKPARVVIMGAGVAGLQAIATAKRLGAIVECSDIREVVKEQIESLGGKFIPLPETEEKGEGEGGYAREMTPEYLQKQRAIVAEHVAKADVVVTTALVPGKKAPMLISKDMVESMRTGGVIVDLATAQGGNCELSEADTEVNHNGVLILGPTNLPAETPHDASSLFSRNVWNLLKSIWKEGAVVLDTEEDEVVDGALLTHQGEVRHAPTRELLEKEG